MSYGQFKQHTYKLVFMKSIFLFHAFHGCLFIFKTDNEKLNSQTVSFTTKAIWSSILLYAAVIKEQVCFQMRVKIEAVDDSLEFPCMF